MTVNSKRAVFSLLGENRESLCALGVCKIGLFGSFVRDQATETSDVDLIVEFEKGKKTFDNFMQLSFLLEEIFHRRVELITPESLSPYMKSHIISEVEYVPLAG